MCVCVCKIHERAVSGTIQGSAHDCHLERKEVNHLSPPVVLDAFTETPSDRSTREGEPRKLSWSLSVEDRAWSLGKIAARICGAGNWKRRSYPGKKTFSRNAYKDFS